jgi:hypothetical protein
MSRSSKAVSLVALLAGIFGCIRWLALGGAALPWVSEAVALVAVRSLVVVMGLAAWFVSQSLVSARGFPDGVVGDAVHDWTSGLNRWLSSRPRAANALLIASSACIDLFGVFLIGTALFGPSMRPGIGLLLLFVLRQLSQLTCALPAPAGMIWRHPGVPSMLVTYHVANDFFFSGHTAIAVIGAIEVARVAPVWFAVVAAVVAFLEAATVLVLRAHYTMDVLAAIFAAFFAAGVAALLTGAFGF